MPLRPAQDSWLAALPQCLEISGLSGQGTNANRVYCLTLTDQRVDSVVYVAADGSGISLIYDDGAWSVKPSVDSQHAYIYAEGEGISACDVAAAEWQVSNGASWAAVPSAFSVRAVAGLANTRRAPQAAQAPAHAARDTRCACHPSRNNNHFGATDTGSSQPAAPTRPQSHARQRPMSVVQPLSTTRVASRPRTVSPPAGSGGQPHVHFSRFDPSRSRELDERRAAASNRRRLAVAEQLRASSVRRARQRLSGAQLEPAAAVATASAGGRHARSNAFANDPGARIFNKQD